MLHNGQRLGDYEILAALGAGGMGEVYRARDIRLGRPVALKVLREDFDHDAERLRRFESEALALGALNHPNVVMVFSAGEDAGLPYLVTELLEGATLKERMKGGPLPVHKALEYASQIARGLAAAHEKGILHRDVKPENVFVTREGTVKLLDFGIAHANSAVPVVGTLALTQSSAVMGTAGYMSPEQVRGQHADLRSDVFGLGAVLYEMLSGTRAFDGATPVDRGYAVLNTDPPQLAVSPAVEKVVRRCLEKSPDERFQSARDVAYALEAAGENAAQPVVHRSSPKQWALATLLGLALVGLGGAVATVARRPLAPVVPRFTPLTFRRGPVRSARFDSDGKNVVYSAAWEGPLQKLFRMNLKSLEPNSLGLEGLVMSISASDELVFLLGGVDSPAHGLLTLARAGMSGQGSRELLDAVLYADWAPDGSGPLIVTASVERERLEFPIGTILFESVPGHIVDPRFSPRGDLIAFAHHTSDYDEAGEIMVVDLAGHSRTLASGFSDLRGLAWSPSGDEVWFTAEDRSGSALRAVTPSGRQRVLAQVPGTLELFDVQRDGRALVALKTDRMVTIGLRPGEEQERDLSWFGYSMLEDISADGTSVTFSESVPGRAVQAYVRKTDGSPAVRLGPGFAQAISPDGKWVLSITEQPQSRIVLLPTGAGEPRPILCEGIEPVSGRWFPDGKQLLVAGHEPGHADGLYVLPLSGGVPRALTPPGIDARDFAVAPDGTVAAAGAGGYRLYSEHYDSKRLPPAERMTAFSADGRWLYSYGGEFPCRISRLDLATGRQEPWKVVAASDSVGVSYCSKVKVTPDGRGYAYRYKRELSTLYLLEGLR